MKIAALADLHANLPALERVIADLHQWRPDLVLVAGDIVNRGPSPVRCLELVRRYRNDARWRVIRGNHEDYVLELATRPVSSLEREVHRHTVWTSERLGDRVSDLERLPDGMSLRIDGAEVRMVHASMLGNRVGVFPGMRKPELRHRMSPLPSLLCVGHTHRPMRAEVDGALVVNVGSVGMPFDGDARVSYVRITRHRQSWSTRFIRLEYDRDAARSAFEDEGFMEGAGPIARLVRWEFDQARPCLFDWTNRFQAHVLAGELSMEDAVNRFLSDR